MPECSKIEFLSLKCYERSFQGKRIIIQGMFVIDYLKRVWDYFYQHENILPSLDAIPVLPLHPDQQFLVVNYSCCPVDVDITFRTQMIGIINTYFWIVSYLPDFTTCPGSGKPDDEILPDGKWIHGPYLGLTEGVDGDKSAIRCLIDYFMSRQDNGIPVYG